MLQASKLLPQGAGLAPALLRRASEVALSWDLRQKSRFGVRDSQGRDLGVFLPRGSVLRGGDVLVAEDGSLIRVLAAAQAVLRITQDPAHGSVFDLMRAAYHLGNRHVPIEIKPDHLKIEPDHVLADLLRAMGLVVHSVEQAFEPESGAYASNGHAAHAQGPGHAHDHGHDHGHDHDHGHGHAHDHGHDHAHGTRDDHSA